MKLLRGRKQTIDADVAVTEQLRQRAARQNTEVLRIWRPPRHVAFGKRDVQEAGYSEARRIAKRRGYETLKREVGGRAVAYTGQTVALAWAKPVDDARTAIGADYRTMASEMCDALNQYGISPVEGEPDRSFCPGSHSLMVHGKLAGIAQRITTDAKLIAALVVVRDHELIAADLAPIYDALDVPFDPDSVGSIERATGRGDPEDVIDLLCSEMMGGNHSVSEIRGAG